MLDIPAIERLAYRLNRERNLRLLRQRNRESDLFCGETIYRGKYTQWHGFNRSKKFFNTVATADLSEFDPDWEQKMEDI